MLLDAATIRDLEILSPLSRTGQTLWSFVDRTHTRSGRRLLRDRLVAASNSREEILARQRAHRELAEDSLAFSAAIRRLGCEMVEQYLRSNWQMPRAMRKGPPVLRTLGRLAWYGQYLSEVRASRRSVENFLQSASALQQRLAVSRADLLRRSADDLAALLAASEAQTLLTLCSRHSRADLTAFDEFARGDGRALLFRLIDAIGEVDAMWSLAAATAEHGWSYPTPGSRLHVNGLYHPFLAAQAIANDLHLDAGSRVCFVTGPNMAGKSTFLRAIAIASLLAHAGCGVPAAAMEFPVATTVFSSVQTIDDLSSGESFYLSEVRRIKALALTLTEQPSTIAVVDEPFRGTNIHDAAEATLTVVLRLANHPAALAFVASHIVEITPALAADSRIRLFHFAADLSAGEPRFDYRLHDGVSSQRLGMTLLKQEQILELL
jgi:DNA mismatch repair protein MutS